MLTALGILTAHPIRYQTSLWKGFAARKAGAQNGVRPPFGMVGDIAAFERVMAVAITGTLPLQRLRVHISNYDLTRTLTRTIETMETLYFEASGRAVGKLDRTAE